MARTPNEVKQEIKTEIRTNSSLNSFLFPEDGGSNASVFNTIISAVASAIFTFEVLIDGLQDDIQVLADTIPAGNGKWIQAQMFKFQIGDVIQLDSELIPFYSIIDTAKQIITRCSVIEDVSGTVRVKVAKGVAPNLLPLDSGELSAVQDYYFGTSTSEGIGFAGVNTLFISGSPDRLGVTATIHYQGQFIEATVKTNVILAIDSHLATFQIDQFDGVLFMNKLTDSIQSVAGVSRVALTAVEGRRSVDAVGAGTNVPIQGFYITDSGYIISEDTGGSTLNDTITMTLETLT